MRVTGSRLLKDPAVQQAIANIREKVANAAAKADALAAEQAEKVDASKIADAVERRELLTKLARRTGKAMAAIRAMDVLNKMDGVYVTKVANPDGTPLGPRRVVVELVDGPAKVAPV